MSKEIRKNDLVFHIVHGVCRITETPRGKSEGRNYLLVPVFQSRSKARFTVAHDGLEAAGFNKLISGEEAEKILKFFKTGIRKKTNTGNAWELAVTLREEAFTPEPLRDKRRLMKANHCAKSLSSEISISQRISVREAADKIRQNLEAAAKVNGPILAALTNADNL